MNCKACGILQVQHTYLECECVYLKIGCTKPSLFMRFFDLQTGNRMIGCPSKFRFELALVELQQASILFQGHRQEVTDVQAQKFVQRIDDYLYRNYEKPHRGKGYSRALSSFHSAVRALNYLNGFKATYLIIISDQAS